MVFKIVVLLTCDVNVYIRDACEQYAKAAEGLGFELLKLITRSLGLPENHFIQYFEPHNTGRIRLNYYPPCPIPSLALGVSRHRDYAALTVLLQDETGGLQVRGKDGQWIGVKPRRDAFVINLGDLFQVISCSPLHPFECCSTE
jgi:isopenicillin N synthase-like dioxygenase